MSNSLPYSMKDVDYDNAKFRQRSLIKVIAQNILNRNVKRECTKCSTGRFLVILMIFGVAYIMLTHTPSKVITKNIGTEEGKNFFTDGKGRLKNLWGKPLRLPPRLSPDELIIRNETIHKSNKIDSGPDWKDKQQKVKAAFIHAWSGYRNSAMGYDELMPLSHKGTDGLGGLGATVVDALDTAMIMGIDEIEVYKISIGATCNLSWPADRLVVQVLDDSTDIVLKDMIEKECKRWASEGINIRYQIRQGRKGYKAGALKEGLKRDYVQDCEYVAIFDADFQPEPDFLRRSIPFLIHNPEIGLVQARWKFVNADECFLTRMQEMSLDYQFVIEQEGGSSIHAFFSFNGSGGIWRIKTINEAGGWKDRTTVEDMDLAVRAGLKGWKFVFLGDLEVKNELPSTFKAYRSQQHRWACGPANLFRKMVLEIAKNKEVSIWTKFYMIYNFFFIRKIVGTMFTFLFYCVVLPLVSLVPEADVPKWGAIVATFIIATINTLVATPRSLHLAIPWVLFENIMSFHRSKALFIGLFEAKRANEWVVTEKLGDALRNKSDPEPSATKKTTWLKRLRERIHTHELLLSVYLCACGCYGIFYSADRYYVYLFPQSIFFAIAGFGYFGTIVPTLTASNDLSKPLLS